MSSLVVIVSRAAEVLELGPRALGTAPCAKEWRSSERLTPSSYVGVRGPVALCSRTTSGTDRDDGSAGLTAAVAGEIVNAADVCRDLGCKDVGCSPSQLVLAAYEHWGAGLFTRLEGIFSVAIRDETNDLTLAGVDARSVGSMFAARIGGDVWLASDASVFRVDPRFPVQISRDTVAVMITLGFPISGDSLFAGVVGLPLGCHFEVHGSRLLRVRHADDRDLSGGTLRGRAYVDHLQEWVSLLVDEAFSDGANVLPLTGGLDSRLLAAALPPGARPKAFTFGGPEDHDVRAGRRIAEARGLEHRRFALEPDYLVKCADETVRFSEGRLNPAVNITGCLMGQVTDASHFVSGQGGDFGRRFLKTVNLLPDWTVLSAPPEGFLPRAVARHFHPLLDASQLRSLVGLDAIDVEAAGRERVVSAICHTAGLPNVDRLDLYCQEVEYWESRPQLLSARASIWARAPFHTRRWVAAVMAGAPSERVDDLARLRLIQRLDKRVAAVPWVLTRLSLPASQPLLLALRRTKGLHAMSVSLPSWLRGLAASGGRTVKAQLYSHGERREEWIRAGAHKHLRGILLGDRTVDRGLFKTDGVRRLLDEQLAGRNNAMALGQLLNVELWHRRYVDGAAPAGCRESAG